MQRDILEGCEFKKLKHYKLLQFISMLYVTFIIMTMVVENRVAVIGHFKILSGTFVIPLSYVVSDIITEVYGYQIMRRLIWTSVTILYISAVIVLVINNLPSGSFAAQNIAYNNIFSKFLKDVVTYSVAALISIFLNSYAISKLKIFFNGRYFWLRSLGSTAIGEAVFIITWGFLGFSSEFSLPVLLDLMAASYICKLVYNLITIVPSSLIVSFVKNKEQLDAFDYNVKFNPFSMQVD